MNVFTSGLRNRPWEWQVAGLCFILGLLLAGSLRTVSYVNRAGGGPSRIGVPSAVPRGTTDTIRQRDKEIASLRENVNKLEAALAKRSDQSNVLNDQLQKAKVLAGLTAVRGPGIILTLQDSRKDVPSDQVGMKLRYVVHDWDLQQAAHELWASGAEAISVNGQRLAARSAIRCVGPTIQVNGVPLGSPYEMHALGDANTLMSALNMPGGMLEQVRAVDPAMVRIEPRRLLEVPAYTGSTEMRFTHPVVSEDAGGKETSNR